MTCRDDQKLPSTANINVVRDLAAHSISLVNRGMYGTERNSDRHRAKAATLRF